MNSLLIAQNIIKRMFKCKREIIVMLVLPIVAIMLMTYFVGSASTQKIKVGIVNLDSGNYSKELLSKLERQGNLELYNMARNDIKINVKDSKVQVVLLIDNNFSKDIDCGKKTQIEFYSNGQNEAAEKLKQQVNENIQAFYLVCLSAKDIAAKSGKNTETVNGQLFTNIDKGSLGVESDNPGNGGQEKLLQSIGFSMMFIMVIIFNTIGTIIEDRKKLVLARTATFRVRTWEIAVGNLLGTLFIGVIQILLITIITAYIYKLPFGIKMYGLFLLLLCFIFSVIGLAIGLSGIIKDNLNPNLLLAVVSFPMCLLGGCLIPESLMPQALRNIGYIVPQKWVMSALSDLMGGVSTDKIFLKAVIVLMFGLAFITFGVKTIRPLDD